MKLFTVGPVEMFPETLKISGKQLPYFRTDDFSKIMLDSENLLKKLSYADDDARVVFLTASGTGAMEATVINCLTKEDKILVINGGSFGKRFCEICGIHELTYTPIKLEFGMALTEEILYSYDGLGYTALLVNIDETSTGQLYNMKMLSDFCKKNNMLFIVDAISSFLADEIKMKGSCIDALIVSSQKALSLSPGLSIVILSPRMIKDRIDNIDSHSLYFDFKHHLKDGERGQTPFTPAVGTLLELNSMLHTIDEMGVEEKIRHTRENALHFRSLIKELPVSIPEFPLSNAVTPVIFNNANAYEIYTEMSNRFDIVLTPSGGNLREKILRVSHIGNLEKEDYDDLLSKLKIVLEQK